MGRIKNGPRKKPISDRDVLTSTGRRIIKAKPGRARVLKTDSGRSITHGQLISGLLKQANVDVRVIDGKLPSHVDCMVCGLPVEVKGRGKGFLPNGHRSCMLNRAWGTCKTCGAEIKRDASRRNGLCKRCALKKPRSDDAFIKMIGLVFQDWIVLSRSESTAASPARRWQVQCIHCGFKDDLRGEVIRRGSYHRYCSAFSFQRTKLTVTADDRA